MWLSQCAPISPTPGAGERDSQIIIIYHKYISILNIDIDNRLRKYGYETLLPPPLVQPCRVKYGEVRTSYRRDHGLLCATRKIIQCSCNITVDHSSILVLSSRSRTKSWIYTRRDTHGLCTVHATTKEHSMHGPCTVPARSLHNEHLMHTPCTVSPCTLPARSMHGNI